MPIVQFVTNVSKEQIPDGLAERAANFTADQLGTPRKAVVVMIKHEVMFRVGSDEPCLVIKLACLDAFNDHDTNRKYSQEFVDFAAAELGLPLGRIVLLMENQNRWEIGLPDGRLIGDRLKAMKAGSK